MIKDSIFQNKINPTSTHNLNKKVKIDPQMIKLQLLKNLTFSKIINSRINFQKLVSSIFLLMINHSQKNTT